MKYPGGKGGAGVYQTIINMIPPHSLYIETHLGGGAIMEKKRPAAASIGIDVDPAVIDAWRACAVPGLQLHHGDAVAWLRARKWTGGEFIYADPPYVMDSRRGGPIYRHEYTDGDHLGLIKVLARVPCPVMVSGYASDLYDGTPLAGWRRSTFQAMTRAGLATEHLWMNYPEPSRLHDSRHTGANYRERERIKRRRERWAARLRRLDPLEREAIWESLVEIMAAA